MKSPEELAHLIHEALAQIGWEAEAKPLADRIARLHIGLPCEDEFSVICSWLGKCALVHKLDQKQTPATSKKSFQVPDLLAIFDTANGQISTLIEVKSNNSNVLSFKPEYMASLRNYASTINLPLLIAWKYKGIWSLFDAAHMKVAEKNFNISFTDAFCETLLGVLAGDFSYSMAADAGINIVFRKQQLVEERTIDSSNSEQEWLTVIEDVYYIDGAGEIRRNVPHDIQQLFMAHDLPEQQEHSETHMKIFCKIGEDKHKFAHMALSRLLNWHETNEASIDWRSVMGKQQPLVGIANFQEAANSALREGFVTHIFHIQPKSPPPSIIKLHKNT